MAKEAIETTEPSTVPVANLTGEPPVVAAPTEPDVNDPSLSERERGLMQAQIAERKKRQELEAAIPQMVSEQVQQQMLLNQAQTAPQQVPQQQSQEEQMATWLRSQGIDPEYATPVQMATAFRGILEQNNVAMQRQAFINQTTDYLSIVGTRNALGQYVKPDGTPSAFQIALNKEPYLAQSVSSEQAAYAIGKRELEIAQLQTGRTNINQNQNNQMLSAAATAPMPAVSAGGGGMVSTDAGIENMDPNSPEFEAYTERVRSGEFDNM